MLTSRLALRACLAVAVMQAHAVFAQDARAADDSRPAEKVSFYFAAHQDDWQLFMNPSAFEDVTAAGTRTVFVHLTAGDNGLGIGSGGRKHPLYLARENGAEAAIRFMADTDGLPGDEATARMRFNGHPIFRMSYRNTTAYFLRVPDGNGSGAGFAGTGFQSLWRLARGEVEGLTAVDGSTEYHGWRDLVGTLRAILDFERSRAPSVQLNVPDIDTTINPGDHADHLMTAQAALDAARELGCARRVYYVDYASSKLPENLNAAERDLESSVFAVTAAGVHELDQRANWHWYDQSYVGRNYFRVQEGTGACAAPVATAGLLTPPKP